MTAREDRNTETLTGDDVGRVEDVLGDLPQQTAPPPADGTSEVPGGTPDRREHEGASAGRRVADAVPMAPRGRGLQDEEAPPIAEGIFVCMAHPKTGDVEKACGCDTFTRGAIVGLTTHGDEASVVYTCRGCGAQWRFKGSPVPTWQWVNR